MRFPDDGLLRLTGDYPKYGPSGGEGVDHATITRAQIERELARLIEKAASKISSLGERPCIDMGSLTTDMGMHIAKSSTSSKVS